MFSVCQAAAKNILQEKIHLLSGGESRNLVRRGVLANLVEEFAFGRYYQQQVTYIWPDDGYRLLRTCGRQRYNLFSGGGCLPPLAEPLAAINRNTIFTIHLASYGENPHSCELLEDDGLTFNFDKGKMGHGHLAGGRRATAARSWPAAALPDRQQVESPESLLQKLLGPGE